MPPRRSQSSETTTAVPPPPPSTRDCPPIPTEIAQMIADELSIPSACALARTCKNLQEAGEVRIWQHVKCDNNSHTPVTKKLVAISAALERCPRRIAYATMLSIPVLTRQRAALVSAQRRLLRLLAQSAICVEITYNSIGHRTIAYNTVGDRTSKAMLDALQRTMKDIQFATATTVVLPAPVRTRTIDRAESRIPVIGGWLWNPYIWSTDVTCIEYCAALDVLASSFPTARHVGLRTQNSLFEWCVISNPSAAMSPPVPGRRYADRDSDCKLGARAQDLSDLGDRPGKLKDLRSIRLLDEEINPFAFSMSEDAATGPVTPKTRLVEFIPDIAASWNGILVQRYTRQADHETEGALAATGYEPVMTALVSYWPLSRWESGVRFAHIIASRHGADVRLMSEGEFADLKIPDLLARCGRVDLRVTRWRGSMRGGTKQSR